MPGERPTREAVLSYATEHLGLDADSEWLWVARQALMDRLPARGSRRRVWFEGTQLKEEDDGRVARVPFLRLDDGLRREVWVRVAHEHQDDTGAVYDAPYWYLDHDDEDENRHGAEERTEWLPKVAYYRARLRQLIAERREDRVADSGSGSTPPASRGNRPARGAAPSGRKGRGRSPKAQRSTNRRARTRTR